MKLGLVGYPVAHSLSPEIHELFLRESGMEGSYELLPTLPEDLPHVLLLLRRGEFQGLNITMPHKGRVFDLCDRRTAASNATGTVNTAKVEGGLLLGHNTDTEAFAAEAAVLPSPFIVVGGGGASRAVCAALAGREYRVFARNPARKDQLPLQSAAEYLSGPSGTVVNTTPLGWHDDDPFPVAPPAGWAFIDLNYNPAWKWRSDLRARSITVVTGESMLVRQAALSFCFWTGITIRGDLFRTALNHVRRLFG